jgi:hypothetical protein
MRGRLRTVFVASSSWLHFHHPSHCCFSPPPGDLPWKITCVPVSGPGGDLVMQSLPPSKWTNEALMRMSQSRKQSWAELTGGAATGGLAAGGQLQGGAAVPEFLVEWHQYTTTLNPRERVNYGEQSPRVMCTAGWEAGEREGRGAEPPAITIPICLISLTPQSTLTHFPFPHSSFFRPLLPAAYLHSILDTAELMEPPRPVPVLRAGRKRLAEAPAPAEHPPGRPCPCPEQAVRQQQGQLQHLYQQQHQQQEHDLPAPVSHVGESPADQQVSYCGVESNDGLSEERAGSCRGSSLWLGSEGLSGEAAGREEGASAEEGAGSLRLAAQSGGLAAASSCGSECAAGQELSWSCHDGKAACPRPRIRIEYEVMALRSDQ